MNENAARAAIMSSRLFFGESIPANQSGALLDAMAAELTAKDQRIRELEAALAAETGRKFKRGDRVRKIKGSSWHGAVVGFYSTRLTPIGYCVESERETGSVQIYPEAALELHTPAAIRAGAPR